MDVKNQIKQTNKQKTFANSLDLDKARHKKVGLDLHLNSVRSDVDPLMMFLGELFQNDFYANSLDQIKPDIIMSGLALRPRHARIQMGGGEMGSGGPLLKYHKNIVSSAIGPDP